MSGPTDTIVLIHGLWMTPRSWEHWITRYESLGYTVLAPPWPGLEGEVEELRRDSTPLANVRLKRVIERYDDIIRRLPNQPIIIGHSTGGTIVQVLLDRGLGAAGVAIAPGAVKGVRDVSLSTLKASGHILANPFTRGKATPSSVKQFRYAFGNTQTEAESLAVYERYYVPSANNVLFDIAFANLSREWTTSVNFAKDKRAPMLFIVGEKDHVVPPKAAMSNAKKYTNESVVTDYKEFPGRSHFTLGQPGWDEVADYALNWALAQTTTRASINAGRTRPANAQA